MKPIKNVKKINLWLLSRQLFLLLFFIQLLNTAWISDDAAITLRTVLNFINGYGPTFNIGERVQAFTHPLWFFLLSFFSIAVGNVFYACFLLSIIVSILVIYLFLFRVTTIQPNIMLVCIVLFFSKGYLDFSTSGLENPLSHLLLMLLIINHDNHTKLKNHSKLTFFFLIISCVYLTRPDHILLVFPFVILVLIENKHMGSVLIKQMLMGFSPIIIWMLFSLFYYGFPFPNTAYAKLSTGISSYEGIQQGLEFFYDAFFHETLMLMFLLIGCAVGSKGSRMERALILGNVLYLCYLMCIGGDFMQGRFLTLPFLVVCVLVSRIRMSKREMGLMIMFIFLGIIPAINHILINGSAFKQTRIRANGIVDERGFNFSKYGLLTASDKIFVSHDWRNTKNRTVYITCGGLGFYSLQLGPEAHIIDPCGLTDPLLSHLPAKHNALWRPGHLYRQLPTNYAASVIEKDNFLSDDKSKIFFESIRMITQGPILNARRFKEIVNINLGLIPKPKQAMYQHEAIPCMAQNIKISQSTFDAANKICLRYQKYNRKITHSLKRI